MACVGESQGVREKYIITKKRRGGRSRGREVIRIYSTEYLLNGEVERTGKTSERISLLIPLYRSVKGGRGNFSDS